MIHKSFRNYAQTAEAYCMVRTNNRGTRTAPADPFMLFDCARVWINMPPEIWKYDIIVSCLCYL